MTLWFIRVFFLIISTFVGVYIGSIHYSPVVGAFLGTAAGILLIVLEAQLKSVSVRGLSSMVFGLLLGVFMAKLVADILSLLPLGDYVHSVSRVILTVVFSYLGAVIALRGKDEFNVIIPYVRFKRQELEDQIIILDTSAIIDGRIIDIAKTNFVNGRILIPRFVLQELQRISDSDDDIKRQRGRRGLDILRSMQNDSSLDIKIHDEDLPQDQDVDTKLIRLAKLMDAKIYTLDFNLGKVASLQGIEILNINELVSAVKPVVFPSEEMHVRLIKEGKEPNQAIAYTDDGTMIVVADAGHLIGQEARVTVVSTLQTQSGRMIFAKLTK